MGLIVNFKLKYQKAKFNNVEIRNVEIRNANLRGVFGDCILSSLRFFSSDESALCWPVSRKGKIYINLVKESFLSLLVIAFELKFFRDVLAVPRRSEKNAFFFLHYMILDFLSKMYDFE